MPALLQLAEPRGYRPTDWDLKRDDAGRLYWVRLFHEHRVSLLRHIRESYPHASAARMEAFQAADYESFERVARHPERFEQIDILTLERMRGALLTAHGFSDAFAAVKRRENEIALRLLPRTLRALSEEADGERISRLARQLMIGNLWDLGAIATIDLYETGQLSAEEPLVQVPARPWRWDDVDRWRAAWERGYQPRHAGYFIDNAGADFWLGCLPLTAWLLSRGVRVTLVGNSRPKLNDITAEELESLLPRAVECSAALCQAWDDGRLRVTASGSGTALIDLSQLSEPCVTALADADLIILHGMGRAVESNWSAAFSCDVLRTATVKDAGVAAHIGGQLFDCVFRFERGGASIP